MSIALGKGAVRVRVAGADDAGAIAALRAQWSAAEDAAFAERMAEWLADEGDRRTTWLAERGGEPVGMASMFEYRRMPRPGRPDSRWGYVSNVFVCEAARGQGIGSALLRAVIETADERGYVRLVLSPSAESLPLYRRAGFVDADATAHGDRLLVRPG